MKIINRVYVPRFGIMTATQHEYVPVKSQIEFVNWSNELTQCNGTSEKQRDETEIIYVTFR